MSVDNSHGASSIIGHPEIGYGEAAGTAARADDTIVCMWRTGDWRDSPWYLVVGGVAIALGGLGAIAGDTSRPSWSRWLALAGMVVGVAVPVYVLWRRFLRSGRGRHGKQ